jgi:hypothetical protein
MIALFSEFSQNASFSYFWEKVVLKVEKSTGEL